MNGGYLVLAKWTEDGAPTYADEYTAEEYVGIKSALEAAQDQYSDALSIQVIDVRSGATQTSTRRMIEQIVTVRSEEFTRNVEEGGTIDREWRRG